MQIFLVGTIFETAVSLDKRRLNKQIIETKQILKAIFGESSYWKNHPVSKMYSKHTDWLKLYVACLEKFRDGYLDDARIISENAEEIRPLFTFDHAFIENMKRRLYTKDPNHYSQWAELGESYVNLYYVDNEWLRYEQKIKS